MIDLHCIVGFTETTALMFESFLFFVDGILFSRPVPWRINMLTPLAEVIDTAFREEFVKVWEARNRLKFSNTILYTVARELASETIGKSASDRFNDGLIGKTIYGELINVRQVKCLGQFESPIHGVVVYYPEHNMDFSSLGVLEVLVLNNEYIKVASKGITAKKDGTSYAFELEISPKSNSEYGLEGTFCVLDHGRVLRGKVRGLDALDTFLWLKYWLQPDPE